MKIVFLDRKTLGNVDLTPLKKLGVLKIYDVTPPEKLIERAEDAEVIITNKVVVDGKSMKRLKGLKLICVSATGMNNIDLESAKDMGIEVKNVESYSTASVVQHTFSILFYLIGRSRYFDEYVKSKRWSKSDIFTNLDREFFEIKDKKWGIIGLGEIGKSVARVARAFGVDVYYYSTAKKPHSNEFKHKELDWILSQCDIISIHSPLNQNTKNLITKKELNLLKDGAVLLNLGRGGIIDEVALARKIDNSSIFVGLDVTSNEPLPEDSPLLNIKNSEQLFITPHIAWASKEARKRLIELIAKNIKEYMKFSK